MKSWKRAAILVGAFLVVVVPVITAAATSSRGGGASPDRPPFGQEEGEGEEEGGDYLRLRDRHIARLRGIEPGRFADPRWRVRAVRRERRQKQEQLQQAAQQQPAQDVALSASSPWTQIGPENVLNGQALDGSDTAVSGRVTAIAVDPTNSNKVYLGTAQGGVWRSLDAGANWTPIFDTAQSLAIGALAVAPSSPSTLYVGTGEPHQSLDSFFGVGVYRIDNADTSATLVGPIDPQITFTCNPSACSGSFTTNAFTGRAVSQILVHPANAGTIFVSTTTGGSGLGGNALSGSLPPLGVLGVYRSTNATAAAGSVAFQKLAVGTASSYDSPPTGNRRIPDVAFVNGDPNTLLVSTFGNNAANDGGIFRSTNALAATPTFSQTRQASIQRIAFAVRANTVLAATSESTGSGGGTLRRSTDGGVTWPTTLSAANGFCGGQCFYDVVVGIDPRSVAPNLRIYLGGSARGTFTDGMKVSTNGGTTFTRDDSGLHADSHAIVFDALPNPSIVYAGNDGGVWKRSATAAPGTLWTNLNNNLATLQFQSLGVGRSDPFFGIGGTQDNGTEIHQSGPGNWAQADYGDGGFALIDQSTTSTSSVTMYHTYFNQTNNLIGFARTNQASCAFKGGWEVRGFINAGPGTACDGMPLTAANGISGTDNVVFYAPMALGPGTPNTVYFGTDRLYRSTNRGDTMSVVSQAPIDIFTNSPITAIGISPANDNVRIVGLQNGQVWAATTGSSALTNITSGSFPANPTGTTNKWIGRAVIDPNNSNTAYVTFSFYAPAGQAVWKITNLSQAVSGAQSPNWVPAASGIPSVPANAFVVDPNDSTHLFAGTDIGVYGSTDSGATWAPFGTGLPAVAVFDMQIVQPGTANESLRVATHGRSMWQVSLSDPAGYQHPQTAAQIGVSLVPVFKACGAGLNLANSSHPPAYSASGGAIGSCNPPQLNSPSARTGSGGSGSASMTVQSGPATSDVQLNIVDSDIQTASGADYDPTPGAVGADLKAVFRLRLTDLNNCSPTPCGAPYAQAASSTDTDFGPIPFDCVQNGNTSIPPGSNCNLTTTANTFMPGSVVSGKQAIWQLFRVRVNDSANALFQQQGFFTP